MPKKILGKISQPMLIVILLVITAIIATVLLKKQSAVSNEDAHAEEGHSEEGHSEEGHNEIAKQKNESKNEHGDQQDDDSKAEAHSEGEMSLSPTQLVEQGIQLARVGQGSVSQVASIAGKLVVNTDQQAHVSPNFNGHVERVNVALGQSVQKGQTLAVLTVPELIDQQANLQMAQSNLQLASQDYQREKQLWNQGVSAKQDYQRAENAFRQAQISVQSLRNRIRALGGVASSNGQFAIKAPISGVISQKDIVVGENVQLADQLFVIEQLKDLWLEFNVSAQQAQSLKAQQQIRFETLPDRESYSAIIESITTQADVQTGRLVVRAKVTSQATALRPNVMVNVMLESGQSKTVTRVLKQAVQMIEGKTSVFVVEQSNAKAVHFKAQPVVLGQSSSDGQWLEVISGLAEGMQYASQGSFLLKSELEKGEAAHEH